MAGTFSIFVKQDLAMKMIPRRPRTGSIRHVARRMASLKIERHSLAQAVLTCRLTNSKIIIII